MKNKLSYGIDGKHRKDMFKLQNKTEDSPLGLISIDSLFSPVKVFSVENTRAGSALDYDKLLMTVETNGTVDAEDVIALGRIFQDQLSMFVNFEDPQEVVKEVKSSEPEFNRNLLELKNLSYQ